MHIRLFSLNEVHKKFALKKESGNMVFKIPSKISG